MWLARRCRCLDDPWELRGGLNQPKLLCIKQRQIHIGTGDPRLRGAPLERSDAGMRILDVEDRIVLRRLHHLGEVEVHLGIGLASQHGEADHILADFLDDIGKRHEIARALAHFDQFAVAHEPDHLDQLDVELGLAAGERLYRRNDALDGARMVRPPDIDQLVGRLGLLEVIGEIGTEIGPGAVRLLDRPILIVAELRRAEQRQFDRFPVLGRLALGRFEHAVIDIAARAQPRLGLFRLARGLELGLGREQVVMDAEQRQVGADHVHHRGDGDLTEEHEPFALGRADISVAELGGELRTNRLQIVAGIETGWNLDRLAQRFPIPKMRRAGEHVDLAARVVDIIFPDHLVPGEFEQGSERIAHHRAAAMAHMHRARRIGRDIFDVHGRARAHGGAAIFVAGIEDCHQLAAPGRVGERQVDEAGARDRDRGDFVQLLQLRADLLGQRTRIGARRLGEDHRGIGGQISMRGVARRLDGDRTSLQPRRQVTGEDERIQSEVQMRGEACVERHSGFQWLRKRAP